MQDDNLRKLLEDLRSGDVAPQWRSEQAWERLDNRLAKVYKAGRELWIYTAAAAVLILGLFLIPLRKSVFIAHRFGPAATEPALATTDVANMAKPIVHKVRIVPSAMIPVVGRPKSIQSPVITTVPDTIVIARNTVSDRPLPPQQRPLIKRKPDVVYTLNEIMAELPEHEAPPKKYSSIFHSRHSTATTPSPSFRRKSAIEEPAPEIPNIIN